MISTLTRVLGCAFVALCVNQASLNRVPGGAIVGRVTDTAGQAIPGANVDLAGAAGLRLTAVSDESGRYRFEQLPAGQYTLAFKLSGFQPKVAQDVQVKSYELTTVDAQLAIAALCEDCSPWVFSGPVVRVITTLGNIDIEVDAFHAPVTAANFLKYVDAGLYTNGRFHRATREDNYTVNLPNRPLLECIQAGINPDRRSEGFPPIPLERTSVTGLKHVVGTVSMARAPGADTATSDFFILLNDQPSLDFGGKRFDDAQGAAAFGRVVAGMDVVKNIQQQPVEQQRLTPPVTITSITRLTK
jgi:peptidyl-prolyl cis-trans isomerase A (cyclophilin A)